MKFGFSTNAYTSNSLIYAIESISDVGYDGVEIVLDVPHAFLPISKSKINLIKKCTKKCNIEITNLNANTVIGWYKKPLKIEKFEPSLSNESDKLRKWRVSYTKKAIECAYELESPTVSITTGVENDIHKNSLEKFYDSLVELANFSERKDIRLAIEYEPGLLIGSSEDLIPVLNEFKNIGVNFDTCHASVLGENMPKIIKKIGKRIFHTHISDCKNRKHYHLIPGKGTVNFKNVIRALRDVNYEGFLTAELYTYSSNPEYAANETMSFLRRLNKVEIH